DRNREDGGKRRFVLIEMGDHFDTVILPRLKKVTFAPDWKGGKPARAPTAEEVERSPRAFKALRLESYEDTLCNLELHRDATRAAVLELSEAKGPGRLREEYVLRAMLDQESRSSVAADGRSDI